MEEEEEEVMLEMPKDNTKEDHSGAKVVNKTDPEAGNKSPILRDSKEGSDKKSGSRLKRMSRMAGKKKEAKYEITQVRNKKKGKVDKSKSGGNNGIRSGIRRTYRMFRFTILFFLAILVIGIIVAIVIYVKRQVPLALTTNSLSEATNSTPEATNSTSEATNNTSEATNSTSEATDSTSEATNNTSEATNSTSED